MFRRIRCWRICCGSSILIASVCLFLISMYSISSISKNSSRTGLMKSISQFRVPTSMGICTDIKDSYYFLDAVIVNQPEFIRFLKEMQWMPLILIDQNLLEALLLNDSIDTHFIVRGEFFQFALQQRDWHCLQSSIADIGQEWSLDVTESAVAFQHKQQPKVKILVRKLIDKTADYQILLPFAGHFLQTDKRTIAFVRIKSTLQIALNGSRVFIPSNPRLFLQRFKRGYFIDCKQPANRNAEPKEINKKSIDDLANVRDFFELIGAMFYLEAGTLLGWYRDCAIIEHTTDLDVSLPIEYYTAQFRWNLFNNDFFRVWKQFGRENDSLELATFLGPFGRGEKLDIFFNYEMPYYSFVGGWAIPDYLLWYKLPKRSGYCSGDLYGRLFTVPCNIEDWLMATYGNTFMTKQAANWERENGTYAGALNYHIRGRYKESDISVTFYKHPLYGV